MGLYSTGWDQQNVVGNLVIQPLVFLGGVFYSIAALREPWRALTHFDPIFYMVVAARHGMLGTSEVDAGVAVAVTLGLAAHHGRLGLGDLRARGGNPHLTAGALGSRATWSQATILRRSWELYRAHLRHLVIIAAVVFVPLGAVTAPLTLAGWPGVVGANVLVLSGLFLVNGALVRAVDDSRRGRPELSVAETFRLAGPRLLVLAVAGVLAAVGIFVGLLLLVLPGLVLLTWWFVLSPVWSWRTAASWRRSAAAAGWCAGTAGRSSAWPSSRSWWSWW